MKKKMNVIVEYKDNYKATWTEYVENSTRATIAHQIGWKQVMKEGLGHVPRYLLAKEGDRIKGILPLCITKTWWLSKYVVSLPWIDYGGICADDPEARDLLFNKACEIAKEENAKFIEFRSVVTNNLNMVSRQDKVTFLLGLDNDPEEIWKGFNAKLKNQIRKAQKSGLTTEFGGLEKIGLFYKVFSHKMRDLGTPVWSIDFFKSIFKTFPDTTRIVLVKRDGIPLAGGLLLSFKNRLYVPSASAYRSSLKYCPNHILYWDVIRKGCQEGFRYLDFGRSTKNSGTFNFKKQWVPSPTQLTWQYYLYKAKDIPSINPSNPKYRIFIGLWKRLPIPIANFLGPKVIRNFP